MKKKMMVALALSAIPFLAGCVALDVAYLAGQVMTQELSTIARAESDVLIKNDVKVYAVKMFQQHPMWVPPCKYSGVLVEYAQDWDEVDTEGRVIRKAAPDGKAGYALILNKEDCPEKEPADILKVGTREDHYMFGASKYVIREGHGHLAMNYLEMNPELRPEWMPQVIRTIKSEAASNPDAADFLAQTQNRSDTKLFN